MNGMLPKHKTLIAAMTAVLLLCACGWILLVRPRQQLVNEGIETLSRKRESLRKRGWPLDRERLEVLLEERRRILEGDGRALAGLNARSEQVLHHATSLFRPQIQSRFGSDELFVRNASNIDFREAFNQLQHRCAGEGIWLAPEVLNLSETASTPYTYQVLLQVWTLDRLVDLVLDHRLLVAAHGGVEVSAGRRRHPAAGISMRPVKAYYLSAGSRQPYLVEIPVHMRLEGDLADVRQFLGSLVTETDFIPPMHAEIYAADPGDDANRTDTGVLIQRVTLDVVCSSFFQFPFADEGSADPGNTGVRPPGGV